MNRTLSRLPLVLGVAVTALLASGVAFTATVKSATLVLDGQAREVAFRGDTVEDLLQAAGLSPGEHDVLVPAATSSLENGARVALRRGRQVELVVDGAPRQVWVTATSVDEILAQVGLREQNLALSASRSREVPLDGLRLEVRTPKRIAIFADNATVERETTAVTVGEALAEAGVVTDADDRLSVPATDPVVAGMQIQVLRVAVDRVEQDVATPFETEGRPDAGLLEGESKELTAGREGLVRNTVERVLVDGVLETSTVLTSTPITAPVTRVMAVGTKARPPAPKPAPAPAPASTPRTGTAGADGLNWPALARCESGGNPRAVSPGGRYRGLYQFSLATWRGVGGSGDPIDNSAEEQLFRAKLLYNRSGAGQWPTCGRRLFT